MSRISPGKPAASCIGCFAWGVLPGRYCRACYSFGQTHEAGNCAACRRVVPLKKHYCRLCWMQASLEAKGQVTVLEPFLRKVGCHQLSFADMQRWGARAPGQRIGKQGRRGRRPRPGSPPPGPVTGWAQLRLPFDASRDYSRYARRPHADLANPTLIRARQAARATGEARGWTRWVANDVDRALVILLSSHTGGDTIRHSELFPVLRRYGLSAERTIEILTPLGLFTDDRVPAFETWLQRKLAGITPGIRHDAEDWLRTLRHGGRRTQARSKETAWAYLNEIQPVLKPWSVRYDHLREVTRDDILAVASSLQGSKRHHTLSVLRSLFRHCKKTGTIFRDPAARVRVGRQDYGVILPLQPEEIRDSVSAATTPAARLTLVLAAVHAARPTAIRELCLDDVELGNRRLILGGRVRPLDDLTRQILLDWLSYRRTRWPNTANPHVILSQQTALETGPVSKVWLTTAFRRLDATLERLRVDRQLDEALSHGPDPLHLAAVFGLDDKTAIRYADSARQLLQGTAEDHDPAGSPEPKAQNSP
jgi:site-specific recombinase XerD